MKRMPVTFAGRGERLLANLLDAIFVVIPTLTVAVLLKDTGGISQPINFAILAAYYTYFTAGPWQGTPGKRLMGMYVIRTDGRPLTRRDAIERFLAYTIPSLPLYASFIPEPIAQLLVVCLTLHWFAPILFTDERIGYHDRLCHTRVVAGRLT